MEKSTPSETKCSALNIFFQNHFVCVDALVGDQQFYDYSLHLEKIWDRTVENTLMLPMLLSYGPVVHYGVCSTRGTGNRHWTWQTTMVEPDGWRAIGNDFLTRSRVCVFVFFIHSARFHSFECYTANAQQSFVRNFSITESHRIEKRITELNRIKNNHLCKMERSSEICECKFCQL